MSSVYEALNTATTLYPIDQTQIVSHKGNRSKQTQLKVESFIDLIKERIPEFVGTDFPSSLSAASFCIAIRYTPEADDKNIPFWDKPRLRRQFLFKKADDSSFTIEVLVKNIDRIKNKLTTALETELDGATATKYDCVILHQDLPKNLVKAFRFFEFGRAGLMEHEFDLYYAKREELLSEDKKTIKTSHNCETIEIPSELVPNSLIVSHKGNRSKQTQLKVESFIDLIKERIPEFVGTDFPSSLSAASFCIAIRYTPEADDKNIPFWDKPRLRRQFLFKKADDSSFTIEVLVKNIDRIKNKLTTALETELDGATATKYDCVILHQDLPKNLVKAFRFFEFGRAGLMEHEFDLYYAKREELLSEDKKTIKASHNCETIEIPSELVPNSLT